MSTIYTYKHIDEQKGHSLDTSGEIDVVSDSELESILDEVEKIEENKKQKEVPSSKTTATCEKIFTKEDERVLNQIFDNVEKRQREFEELRVAASEAETQKYVDNDCDSVSSISSKSSRNSEFEKMIDSIECENNECRETDKDSSSSSCSNAESPDEDSSDDDTQRTTSDSSQSEDSDSHIEKTSQNHDDKQRKVSATSKTISSPSTVEQGHKEGTLKRIKKRKLSDNKKTAQKSSKSGGKSDEELDSMVAELLEF